MYHYLKTKDNQYKQLQTINKCLKFSVILKDKNTKENVIIEQININKKYQNRMVVEENSHFVYHFKILQKGILRDYGENVSSSRTIFQQVRLLNNISDGIF